MEMATAVTPADLGTDRRRFPAREAVAGAAIATVANALAWAVGRAAGVSFVVSPLAGQPAMQVGLVSVVVTTFAAFAVGIGLFALAARRSDRWARVVLAAGVLVAVASTGGPLSAAESTASGVLLAAMHLLTGAVFAVTAWRARR